MGKKIILKLNETIISEGYSSDEDLISALQTLKFAQQAYPGSVIEISDGTVEEVQEDIRKKCEKTYEYHITLKIKGMNQQLADNEYTEIIRKIEEGGVEVEEVDLEEYGCDDELCNEEDEWPLGCPYK